MKYNKTPLLTVAIPTYKRPETLEKIIIQLQKEKNQNFTLLISDDSMDDNTENMIKKYHKSMRNLVYSKNKKNLGFSGNVMQLYDLAETRYVWFLCDDDTVLPNTIETMITKLEKYQPVVAVFNAIWIDSYGRESIAGVKKDVIHTKIDKITDYNSLMRTTFLSIVVVEKRMSLEKIKNKDYKDNIFVQVTIALLLLSDKFLYCEFASPIVHRNVGYKYGEFFKFYLIDHLKAITLVDHKFDNKRFIRWSKNHLPTALLLYLSQKIGIFKYNGRPTRKTIKNLIKFYGPHSILLLIFVLLYYLVPSFIIRFMYFFQLVITKGYKNANEIYKKNINRAYTDGRQTGFTSYK